MSLNLNWGTSETVKKHFRTHRKEFPEYAAKEEYVLAAVKFWEKPILLSSPGQLADLLEKMGTQESPRVEDDANTHKIYRYERSTGILSAIQRDPDNPGEILLTFFKPRWDRKDRLAKAFQYYLDQ